MIRQVVKHRARVLGMLELDVWRDLSTAALLCSGSVVLFFPQNERSLSQASEVSCGNFPNLHVRHFEGGVTISQGFDPVCSSYSYQVS